MCHEQYGQFTYVAPYYELQVKWRWKIQGTIWKRYFRFSLVLSFSAPIVSLVAVLVRTGLSAIRGHITVKRMISVTLYMHMHAAKLISIMESVLSGYLRIEVYRIAPNFVVQKFR